MTRRILSLGAVGALVVGTASFAQSRPADVSDAAMDPGNPWTETEAQPGMPTAAPDTNAVQDVATTPPPMEAGTGTSKLDAKANMKGLSVFAGGGVEGYSGDLAPQLNPGPAWGVTAAIRPFREVGVEVGYTGATSEIEDGIEGSQGATNGADIVRNGAQGTVTLGTPTAIQPYVLVGIGVDHYTVRGEPTNGFVSDTSGIVPFGAGVRTHVEDFTVDLRGNYGFMFENEFAAANLVTESVLGVDSIAGARYQGMLQVGGTF